MYIIRGLRYPTALAFGLLLTAAIFWSLWSLTNVTFQLETIPFVPIEVPGVRADTQPELRKTDELVIPPPDIDKIEVVDIVNPSVAIEPVLVREPVKTPPISRPELSFGPDRDAAPIVRINPEYPERARRLGIEGWVTVQYTITGTGAVTDVKVVENEPSNVFDDAAIKAVSRWRYNPKVEGAVAVERVGMQTILRFDLEEE